MDFCDFDITENYVGYTHAEKEWTMRWQTECGSVDGETKTSKVRHINKKTITKSAYTFMYYPHKTRM